MGKELRSKEYLATEEFLKSQGVPTLGYIQPPGKMEGGDVLWIDERTVAIGLGRRTNEEGIRQFKELTKGLVDEYVIVPMPYGDGPDACLPLMSIVSFVDTDKAVVYSKYMPVFFRNYLLEKGFELIECGDKEYDYLGTNLLALEPKKCVLIQGCPEIQKKLEDKGIDFDQLGVRIQELLYRYVAVPSITNTQAERGVEDFFRAYIQEIPYFAQHPDHWGLYPIQGDGLGRSVCWAMVRGSGDKTIVLVHHYDVVDIEDYKTLKSWAYAPEPLREALMQHKDMLPEEARQDLESGKFLFCRGGCDMEGGGSIQYALLEAYSRLPDFQGNVIVLGVPDEENLSAGMRGADRLLAELQDRYGLRYLMMINSEPHQRKDFSRGVFSGGTVGKMMPFIYVRGFLSHAGKVFEGLNPASVLAEIVTRTEVNMEFSDTVQGEAAPPPMWLYMKDSKDRYDVSMPLTAQECFSVLTLKQTPGELMERVKRICEESFAAVIDRLNASYAEFRKRTGRPVERLPWKEKVVTFGELYQEACASGGEAFAAAFAAEQKQLRQELEQGRIYMIEANFRLIDRIYDYIEDISPRIVYGLMPPYYPNVLNCYFADMAPEAQDMSGKLNCYTKERYGQEYDREYFYTGICDLSYINIEDPEEQRKRISQSMPLFGWYYDIPFEEIKKISMAGINIGPWGKDFHKLTERVLMENLYDRTPHILDHAITILLG